MASFADLVVKIGANTRGFDNSLKRVKKGTSGLKKALSKLSAIKMPLLAGAAALTGLGVMAMKGNDAAAATDKLGKKTGFSVNSLGAL